MLLVTMGLKYKFDEIFCKKNVRVILLLSMSNILNMSVIYTVDICGNRYTSGLLDGIYISFLLVLASLIGYILFQHGKSEPIIINVYTNDEDEDEGECECDCECYEEEEEEDEDEDEDEEDIIELSNEEYKLVQTLREMKTMLKEQPTEEEPKEQPKEEEPKEEEPKEEEPKEQPKEEEPKEQPKEEEPKEQQKTEQEQPTVTESALD